MRPFVVIAVFVLLLASVPARADQATATAPPSASVQDSQAIRITRRGTQASRQGSAQYFTGSVHIDPLFEPIAPSRTSAGSVTFEPGARSAWHTQPLGQTLIVTAGSGRVQRWGDPIEEIRQGDVVWIPPGQKHWHGASPTSALTHIAIQEYAGGKNVEWMEKVSDEQYQGNGIGADAVLEYVGTQESMMQAIRSTRPGGSVGYVGFPHGVALDGHELFFSHVRLHGGPAPVRRYLPELIDLVWTGEINTGKVFDLTLPLAEVAEGCRAMDERRAIKTLLRP